MERTFEPQKSRFALAALGVAVLLSGCLGADSGGGDDDPIAEQPIIGTGRGLIATYTNSLNRCSFSHAGATDFDLACHVAIRVGNREVKAKKKANNVRFDWKRPVAADSELGVLVRSCDVSADSLSQQCRITVDNALAANTVEVDLDVEEVAPVSQLPVRARTLTEIILLTFGAETIGFVPQIPLHFQPTLSEAKGILDGVLAFFGLAAGEKLLEIGYQAQKFDSNAFVMDGITSTCATSSHLFYSTPHYVYAHSLEDGHSQIFAGNSSPSNRFSLKEVIPQGPGETELDYDRRVRELWKDFYPDTGQRTDASKALMNKLASVRKARLGVFLGKHIRLACHPSNPDVVFILESFDAQQEQEYENGAQETVRHRLWKTEGDSLRLAVADWGKEEVFGWHHPQDEQQPGSFNVPLSFAPPRDRDRAIGAKFEAIAGIASGPDGTLYLADNGDDRVRALHPDGTISHYVGKGLTKIRYSEEGGERWEFIRADDHSNTNFAEEEVSEIFLANPVGLHVDSQNRLRIAAENGVYRVQGDRVYQEHGKDAKYHEIAMADDGTFYGLRWEDEGILKGKNGQVDFHRPDSANYSWNFSGTLPHLLTLVNGTPTLSFLPRDGDSLAFDWNAQNDPEILSPPEDREGKIVIRTPTGMDSLIGGSQFGLPESGSTLPVEGIQMPEMVDTEVDRAGRIYFIGKGTNRVFVIENRTNSEGRQVRHLTHVAGHTSAGCLNANGTGALGPATDLVLDDPQGLALDSNERLWIADTGNHRVIRIDSDGLAHVMGGNKDCSDQAPYAGDPSISPNQGPHSTDCADASYTCSYCQQQPEEAGVCPDYCQQNPLPQCAEPEGSAEACTIDAHIWKPSEVAVWGRYAYILLREHNAVVRLDTDPGTVEDQKLAMVINDPWDLAERSGAHDPNTPLGSRFCHKYGRFRHITDISVRPEAGGVEALYLTNYDRLVPEGGQGALNTQDKVFRFVDTDFLPANLSSPNQDPSANAVAITGLGVAATDQHPIALSPNAEGGFYLVMANPSAAEQENALPPRYQNEDADPAFYRFEVQAGSTLANLEPQEEAFKAHILVEQNRGGNQDCGSGVVEGQTNEADPDATRRTREGFKASLSTMCRSFTRTVAGNPYCSDTGDSQLVYSQGFTSSVIHEAGVIGETTVTAAEVNRGAPSNAVYARHPCAN